MTNEAYFTRSGYPIPEDATIETGRQGATYATWLGSCRRCGGSGHYSFNLRHGTVCFRCKGARKEWYRHKRVYTREALDRMDERARIKREEKAKKEAIESDARIAERVARDDTFRRAYEAREEDDFLRSLVMQYGRRGLTDLQEKCLPGAVERYERKRAEEEERKDLPMLLDGRRELTGEVLGRRVQEGHWSNTEKMLVRLDDGNKVWGTVPIDLLDVEVGQRVQFTATVEVSAKDEHFGFFSRPKKGKVLK